MALLQHDNHGPQGYNREKQYCCEALNFFSKKTEANEDALTESDVIYSCRKKKSLVRANNSNRRMVIEKIITIIALLMLNRKSFNKILLTNGSRSITDTLRSSSQLLESALLTNDIL